jgi:hypothetical protein
MRPMTGGQEHEGWMEVDEEGLFPAAGNNRSGHTVVALLTPAKTGPACRVVQALPSAVQGFGKAFSSPAVFNRTFPHSIHQASRFRFMASPGLSISIAFVFI